MRTQKRDMDWNEGLQVKRNAEDGAKTLKKAGISPHRRARQLARNRGEKYNKYDVAMYSSQTAVGFGTTETNVYPRLLASLIRHSEGG